MRTSTLREENNKKEAFFRDVAVRGTVARSDLTGRTYTFSSGVI